MTTTVSSTHSIDRFLPRTAALNALLGKMSITVERIGNAFGGAEKRFVSACQRVDAVSTLMRKKLPFLGFCSAIAQDLSLIVQPYTA